MAPPVRTVEPPRALLHVDMPARPRRALAPSAILAPMVVRSVEELRRNPVSALFEGRRDGVELSVFVTTFGPGDGPRLHRHPYAELFLVEEGEARFDVGGEGCEVGAGSFVVVPPETAHRFENSGAGALRVLSIQPSGEVQQTLV